MDRLSLVMRTTVSALLTLAACGEDGAKKAPPPSRVVAVAAKNDTSTSELCDVLPPPESGPMFAFPPLDTPPPAPSTGWRWVNVWASWCAPCVEELPVLGKLRSDLEAKGKKLELVLLSVDGELEAMKKFQAEHPEASGSLRLSQMGALQGWLTSMGLDAGATLPVHFFVDPRGKVRCARTGAVKDTDLGLIEQLLKAG